MRSAMMSLLALVITNGPAEDTPRVQYDSLVREFDTAHKSSIEALNKAINDQDRLKASLGRPQPHEFAPRFFAIAEQHPEDPVALEALSWIASSCVFGEHAERALGMMARDHGRSERLKEFCGQCGRYGEPFPAYEEMLRAVLKVNPHREVRGATTLALADYLKMAKEKTESRLVKIALEGGLPLSEAQMIKMAREGVLPLNLSEAQMKNVQRVKDRGLEAIGVESAALFQEVIDQYADLRIGSDFAQNAAELAKGELFVLRNLCIGRVAPDIVGKDIRGKTMRLADYRGKVVVLDFGSHRSCGVCRQMYPYLRTIAENYRGKPFALLGVSVEDDVKELVSLADKGENTWPIWWDGENLEGPIAAQWVIRSMPTFYVLDPKGVIRNKGFLQPGEIEATVDMLLKEMKQSKP
jgi:peroxiredoxin